MKVTRAIERAKTKIVITPEPTKAAPKKKAVKKTKRKTTKKTD